MRVAFDKIFQVSKDKIGPKCRLRIGAVTFGPGVSTALATIAGLSIGDIIGRDLEVKELDHGLFELTDFHNP